MPSAKKVFKTEKVTKAEAKTVKPLTRYWAKRLKSARDSDNWRILAFGAFLGFVLGLFV